jgi:hypothetical protein
MFNKIFIVYVYSSIGINTGKIYDVELNEQFIGIHIALLLPFVFACCQPIVLEVVPLEQQPNEPNV